MRRAFACTAAFALGSLGLAADIVREGAPQGAVWHKGDQKEAAADLVEFVEKMSGARLEVKAVAEGEKPAADSPAIVLGALALEMGLPKPPETPSLDGYRLQTRRNHLLLAGEAPMSTRFAVTHFLEHHGCRWLMANKWGEVIPQAKTLSLDGFDVSEKPDFAYRNVWGFVPHARSRLGGMDLPNRHDWEHVPAARYFKDHPGYYALRGGERRPGGWLCTSHPDLPRLFADAYVAKSKKGVRADTISPPDGRGFCECAKCKALDVPDYIEPSSGTISMSDRYARFFDAVGQLVGKEAPGFILSFYCYSDYTLPPKTVSKVSDNLCAWVTTIRFCRIHGVNNPRCESRQRYKAVVEGWARLMQTACYDYNYNLAEVTVPISKITYMKDNIPFLKKTGCRGINLESMAAWNLYGPHTYLASRLMWKADADADAILDDYYAKLCGKAAPHVKAYWERIDKAVREADVHVGCFHGIHAIWTPALVKECEADLDAAAKAAETDLERERVALFRSGLESARYYLAVREAINRCDFVAAKQTFDQWLKHMDAAFDKQYNTMRGYKRGYAEWFLRPLIESGLARTVGECKLVAQLPDEWDFRYDPQDAGEKQGWFKDAAAPEGWRKVKTYSATLNEQRIPEQLTWMWYRARLKAPAALPPGPLHLWFGEVDGSPTKVYLNGEPVAEFAGARKPSEVEVTGKLLAGKDNLVVVRTGHLSISELMLGGIVRPAMLYAGPRPEPAPKGGR
ncbi:MAG TPA: DUF4838 domain-containing protein [Planctomycetota bacterium]|nr:DUF4838 domain-containing protein [Planctomycetota bacterium]